MLDAEHLMENGLFAYRKSILEKRLFIDVIHDDKVIMDQLKKCEVDVTSFMYMVGYVYWDVMDVADRFEFFEDGKLI